MAQVGMHEAKTKLSQLVERAEAGEDIVIAGNGRPVVRLVPVPDVSALGSVRGAWRDRVLLADDFDDLPDKSAAPWALGEAAAGYPRSVVVAGG